MKKKGSTKSTVVFAPQAPKGSFNAGKMDRNGSKGGGKKK